MQNSIHSLKDIDKVFKLELTAMQAVGLFAVLGKTSPNSVSENVKTGYYNRIEDIEEIARRDAVNPWNFDMKPLYDSLLNDLIEVQKELKPKTVKLYYAVYRGLPSGVVSTTSMYGCKNNLETLMQNGVRNGTIALISINEVEVPV